MCVQIAAKKDRPRTSSLVTGRSQVPATAGSSEEPAVAGTCDLPVIMELVPGLSFLAAI